MNKFKYRLVENEETGEEESGLKTLKGKNELILTALGGKTADDLMAVLQNPENLKGTYVLKSEGLADLEKRVFGDPKASYDSNEKIYQENGMDLYRKIAKEVGGFKKGTEFTKPGKFRFPEKNKYNLDLIKKYLEKTQETGEKSVRTSLNPVPIDDISLKFQVGERKILEKILQNSKLESGKDYDIKVQKSKDIELREMIKKQISKLFN
jgi:hypothetical protein